MNPDPAPSRRPGAVRRKSEPTASGARLVLTLQNAAPDSEVPSKADLRRWAAAALAVSDTPRGEVTLRLVDETESAELNQHYRGKAGPTNVLSFPFEDPPGVTTAILGDLVVCAPVVNREAAEQQIPPADHWAHIVVHGILHLLGYDHVRDADAQVMEPLETRILAGLGVSDPYA